MIEFPFKPIETEQLGVIFRPVATVNLKGPENEVPTEMIVDSGADISIIPFELGSYLGLQIEKNEDVKSLGGIAGGIPVVYRHIKMEIDELVISAKIAWSLIEDVPAILGRLNIFDEFDIEFKQKAKKTAFKKN
jgi:hypothetical protein